ncbi:hypothetical protein BJX65DRAFT_265973 [Aspergillus insuetus]
MAWSTSQRGVARLMLYAIGVLVIISLIFWSYPFASTTAAGSLDLQHTESSDHSNTITNTTLGVQKIFAISLPSRLDKRDNIVLGSSLSDFHVEFIDAITPDDINPKTYPFNWNYDHRPVEYAARRSHLNALQKIVHERLGSAIIMEDDADWDVSLKTQAQSFAIAVSALQPTDPSSDSASPYGSDWDILWLGHCGIECNPSQPSYLTPNDPTIPPPHHFLPYWRGEPPQHRPNTSRLTCHITDGVCSLLYAVSLRGAQRILSALSVNPSHLAADIDTGAQFDVSLGRLCGSGYIKCFAPYPALTGGYRPAEAKGKGSDINGDEGEVGRPFGGDVEGAFSHGVLYSTLLNVERLLSGETTVKATWEDVDVVEMGLGDVEVLEGSIQPPIKS